MEVLQLKPEIKKEDSYLKRIADTLEAMCVETTEKDSLKARKRFLKAENKEL